MTRAYKKRDRINEKYKDWTVIGKVSDDVWLVECQCGKKKECKSSQLSKQTRCPKCAAQLRKSNGKSHLFRSNFLTPSRRKFKHDQVYEIDYSKCTYPVKGVIINEYTKSASFRVIDCHPVDKNLMKAVGYTVCVSKKYANKVEAVAT